LRDRDNLEEADVDGRTIMRWIFRKCEAGAWTGLMWLMTETGGGLL